MASAYSLRPSTLAHTRHVASGLESAQNGPVLGKYVTSRVACDPITMLILPTFGRHIILYPRVAICRAENAPWGPQEWEHLVLGPPGWTGERPEISRYTFRVSQKI